MCIVIFRLTLLIARQLHNSMLLRVTRAPTSFFDANPLGRILNRFSKDTAVLDSQIPQLYLDFLLYLGILLVSLLLTVIVLPFMGVVLAIMVFLMFKAKHRAARLSNEALRWDAITRSPINSLFSATLRGLITIRAFRQQ